MHKCDGVPTAWRHGSLSWRWCAIGMAPTLRWRNVEMIPYRSSTMVYDQLNEAREAERSQVSNKCPREETVEDDALLMVDEELRRAVGCRWPVRITPGVAELVAPTDEEQARGQSHDSRLRNLLWLAGIALSEMDAPDRVALFDMVIAWPSSTW